MLETLQIYYINLLINKINKIFYYVVDMIPITFIVTSIYNKYFVVKLVVTLVFSEIKYSFFCTLFFVQMKHWYWAVKSTIILHGMTIRANQIKVDNGWHFYLFHFLRKKKKKKKSIKPNKQNLNTKLTTKSRNLTWRYNPARSPNS